MQHLDNAISYLQAHYDNIRECAVNPRTQEVEDEGTQEWLDEIANLINGLKEVR